MPSGLQYYLEYDHQGNLKFLRTPGLGKHYFNQIISIGGTEISLSHPRTRKSIH